MKKKITAAVLAASLGFGLGMTTASAAPNPDKERCKNGGHAALGFKNQGQCIAFVNRGGQLPPEGGGAT